MPFVLKSRKVIYYNIPKNASNSLMHFCAALENIKVAKNKYNIYNLFESSDKYNNNPAYYKMAFVRNPWDRVVSGYKEKIRESFDKSFSDGVFKAWKQYGIHKDTTFAEFVHIISKLKDTVSENHFRSQHTFIKGIKLDFMGRLENMNTDIHFLCKKFNVNDFEIPNLLKIERRPYREYYDRKLKKLVAERYKEDIKLYNYTF